MKKFLALLLSALLLLSLVACADNTNNKDTNEPSSEKHEHSFGEAWKADSTHHWHTCEDESCDEISSKAEHSWDEGKITLEATELKEGAKTFTCTVCGQTKFESIENTAPKTEEEILKYVIDAIAATKAYEGSISITQKRHIANAYNHGGNTGTVKQEELSTQTNSFNANDKTVFVETSTQTNGTETRKSIGKTFFSNGEFYVYMMSKSEDDTTQNSYAKCINGAEEEYTSFDRVTNDLDILDTLDGIALADNLAELNSALSTTLPVILPSLFDDSEASPTYTASVTATNKGDGVYELHISIVATDKSEEKSTDDVTQSTEKNLTLEYVVLASNEKIKSFDVTSEHKMTSSQEEELLQSESQKMHFQLNIDYNFNRESYDNVKVTLPSDPADIEIINNVIDNYEDASLSIYVNGTNCRQVSFDGITNAQDAYDEIIETCGKILTDGVSSIQIFKDEALTQEIKRDTVTDEDIFALEKVHIKITPDSSHALILRSNSKREEYSKPFRIVLPLLDSLGSTASKAFYPPITSIESEYTLPQNMVEGEKYEIWLNGEKLDPKPSTIAITGGNTYYIEFVTVISDPVASKN